MHIQLANLVAELITCGEGNVVNCRPNFESGGLLASTADPRRCSAAEHAGEHTLQELGIFLPAIRRFAESGKIPAVGH